MGIYFLVFIIGFLYYLLAGERKKLSQNNILLALFFTYLAMFVGLGDMIGGYDRYIYGESFDFIADLTWDEQKYTEAIYLVNGIEYGYFVWEVLISLITTNRYIFILITTCLIYMLFYKVFCKFIENYPLACIVFLGLMFFFTMTYLRQMIAIGIAWQGVEFIGKRNAKKFFFYVFLAATFHTAVLIFAVIYFIPLRKISRTNVTYILVLCLIIGLTPIPNIIIASAGDTTGKAGDYVEQDQGFRIEYVLEVIFFMTILFKNYRHIGNDAKTLTFLNMSYVLCAILFVFMRFGQGGRFSWPFFLGIIYIFSTLPEKGKGLFYLKPVLVLTFFALFARINISWAPQQVPYKTFMTNGIPAGNGEMYRQFEYDDRYTSHKFQRPAFTFM